jgi:hypothetical protein
MVIPTFYGNISESHMLRVMITSIGEEFQLVIARWKSNLEDFVYESPPIAASVIGKISVTFSPSSSK